MEKRLKNREEKLALLSGFIRVSFSIYRRGATGGTELSVDCQNEGIRDYIAALMHELFRVAPTAGAQQMTLRPVNNELVFGDGEKILRELYIIAPGDGFELYEISDKIKATACYARGAFLGCGSVSVPSASKASSDKKSGGYHIEFSFSTEQLANAFLSLLAGHNIYAHLTLRAGKYLVYIKDAGDVSDCLALIGADRAVLDMNAAAATYAVKSDINRRINCELANMSRMVEASVGVAEAIELIERTTGLDALDPRLKEAALARKAEPQASIGAIAQSLGISKSGLKHRFDKIVSIAKCGTDK